MEDGGASFTSGGDIRRDEGQKPNRPILLASMVLAAIFLNLTGLLAPELFAGFDATEQQVLAAVQLLILAALGMMILRSLRPSSTASQHLHDTLNMLPVAGALWREDGSLDHCNGMMRRLFDLPEHKSLTQAQVDKIRFCNFGEGQTSNPSDQFEIELPDGKILHITGLQLTNGRCLSVVKDISEHRRTKKRLAESLKENQILTQRFREEALRAEAASRSKTAFLAHLSHDIRTPLNHIIGFAELIRNEAFGSLGSPRYHTYLDDIKSSGERLRDSFAEVLELVELEGGRRELNRDPVDVGELFSDLGIRFADTAERAGIELCFEAPDSCWILGDMAPFHKMVGNLVDNSLRFTPRGGRIRVVAWESEAEIVLEIADSGIGISPERIEELSMPFVLGDAAFTRDHGGMGLGLAISRTIAELSGGRLLIDSTPPLGTSVAISLPRLAQQDVEAA